jgi:hypothetical protein
MAGNCTATGGNLNRRGEFRGTLLYDGTNGDVTFRFEATKEFRPGAFGNDNVLVIQANAKIDLQKNTASGIGTFTFECNALSELTPCDTGKATRVQLSGTIPFLIEFKED